MDRAEFQRVPGVIHDPHAPQGRDDRRDAFVFFSQGFLPSFASKRTGGLEPLFSRGIGLLLEDLRVDDELRSPAGKNIHDALRRPGRHADHALLRQRRAVRRQKDVLQREERVVLQRRLRIVDVDGRPGDDALTSAPRRAPSRRQPPPGRSSPGMRWASSGGASLRSRTFSFPGSAAYAGRPRPPAGRRHPSARRG